MPSERIQRQVDALLEQAEKSINAGDWDAVRTASESALRLDPANEDARAYLEASQRPPGRPAEEAAGTAVAMPEPLASKVRSEIGRAEGERRNVTILFADAQDFTRQSESLDEEAVYEAMRLCLEVMAEAVYDVEGTVTQFRGDGIMAVFGAPIAHEDSARRAVLAALRMQERLDELAGSLRRSHGFNPAFRVGLNTGPVVVGRINDQLEMDFTAIGDTVNLAARMEQAGEPGAVTITDSTRRSIRGYFDCESLGPMHVKGRSAPVDAYRVVRETGARTRLEATIAGGLSEFTGRENEISVLGSYLRLAGDGRPQAVLVSGEAGIGKSRLLHEFRGYGIDAGARWLQGQCSPLAARVPYFPVIEIVRGAVGLTEESSPADVVRAIESCWPELAGGHESPVPYLRFLLTGVAGDERVDRMDPIERQAGLMDALRSLLGREQDRGPIALVVEDLHWIDERSEAVIEALIANPGVQRLLFLATVRPGYVGALADRTDVARVALARLPAEACQAVAVSLLGTRDLPDGFAAWLEARTGGNPLFVEEVVRSLVETGALRMDGDRLMLAGQLSEAAIPDTIQGVILSRLDRLAAPAKEAMQLASVIGREFSVRLLDRLASADGRDLDTATLVGLKSLELIREKQRYPELAYMFKHALTHDVAYSTLLNSRRRELHGLAASAIEQLYPDRLRDHAEVLAGHYKVADDLPSVLHYLIMAGDKAVAGFAINAALATFEEAFDLANRLHDRASAADIQLRLGSTYLGIGRNDAAFAAFERGSSVTDDPHRRGLARGHLALAQYMSALYVEGERTARDTLTVARDAGGDPEVELLARTALVLVLLAIGDSDEARRQGEIAAGLADQVTDPFIQGWAALANWHFVNWEGRFDEAISYMRRWDPVLTSSGSIVLSLGRIWLETLPLVGRGDYERALDMLHRVLAISNRVGDVLWQARALNTIGWVYGELGDPATALEWNKKSLELALASEFPDPMIESNARLNMGDNLVELGRVEEAEGQFRAVEEKVRSPAVLEGGIRYSQHLFHSLGELLLARGDVSGARGYAEECLALAARHRHPKNAVKAERLLGDIEATLGNDVEAVAHYGRAIRAAVSLGNPPQAWKTYAALGRVHAEAGRRVAAMEAYGEALARVRDVADRLITQSLREVFLASREVTLLRSAQGALEE